MQLHTLTTNKNRTKRRVARGGKRGSFSGRGIKGQKARAGRKMRPELRDIIKKIPKHKGYRHSYRKTNIVTVRSSDIAKAFKSGDVITPKALVEKRVIKRVAGRVPNYVKVLGDQKLVAKLELKGLMVTGKVKVEEKSKAKPAPKKPAAKKSAPKKTK